MTKKINVIFLTLIAILSCACITHTAIAYLSISADIFTSAPASVAFFLIIPYFLAALVCGLIWLITLKLFKRK